MTAFLLRWLSINEHPIVLMLACVAVFALFCGVCFLVDIWYARRHPIQIAPFLESKANQAQSFNTPAPKGFSRPTLQQFDRRRTKGGRDAA